MKTLRLTLSLFCFTQLSGFADPDSDAKAKQIADLYQTGLSALKSGQRETAKRAFEGVLKLQPKNGHARYQLATLDQNFDRVMLKKRQQDFANTRLKEVYFDNASLSEALESMDRLASEASANNFSPNFILQDPDKKFGDKRISLQLRNVPLSTVLKYVLETVKGNARYDEHATVIMPRAGLAKPDKAASEDEEESKDEEEEGK